METIGQTPTKRCSRCKEVKKRYEFHKDRRRKQGIGAQCLVCHRKSAHQKPGRTPPSGGHRISLAGYVYVMTNQAWPGTVHIGRSYNPVVRMRSFQGGSPHRDYKLHHKVYFQDCHAAESEIHSRLEHLKTDDTGKYEWFWLSVSATINQINQLREEL